jgi:hypothetical protein
MPVRNFQGMATSGLPAIALRRAVAKLPNDDGRYPATFTRAQSDSGRVTGTHCSRPMADAELSSHAKQIELAACLA